MAVMLITHAMGVVAETAQRVVVMYAGKVVEEAPVAELFARPRHPYTQGLIRSIPRIDTAATHKVRLEAIARRGAEADRAGGGLPLRRRAAGSRGRNASPPRRRCARSSRGTRWPAYWKAPVMTEPLLRVQNLVKHFPLTGRAASGARSTACTRSTA